jgi:hypothetical protein
MKYKFAVLSLIATAAILLSAAQRGEQGILTAAPASGGTNPSLITDVTNSSFCLNVTTCSTSAFTPTTGDLLLVFPYAGNSSATISAPTDTCGGSNTYTSSATNTSSGQQSKLYWTIVGTGGSSCHVTGNYGGTLTGVSEQVYVQDWRGTNTTTPIAASSIGNVNAPGTGSNAISSSLGTGSTISGTQTNNDVAGGTIVCDGNTDTLTAGTGYTLGSIHETVGNCNVAGEYQAFTSVVSSASATFTTTVGTGNFWATFAAVIQHP